MERVLLENDDQDIIPATCLTPDGPLAAVPHG